MREDLQRRIGAAIDSAEGLTGDPELRATLAEDAEAATYARDLVHLQSTLRKWPLPEPSDDAFERLAARIQQRLGDTLPRIDDPTLPPQFDDDDDLRDATAGLLGPVLSSGEFELQEEPPAAKSARPIPPPSVNRVPVSAPPAPKKSASVPPPPVVLLGAATASKPPAAPREMPKLVPSSDGDRLSFPNFPVAPLGAPSLDDKRRQRNEKKGRFGWVAGLAAAAAVGLGVFATTSNYQGEPAPSVQGASGSVTTLSTSDGEGAATGGLARSEEAAPAAQAAQAAPATAAPMPAAPPPTTPGTSAMWEPNAGTLRGPASDMLARESDAEARDEAARAPTRRARRASPSPDPSSPMRIAGARSAGAEPAAREAPMGAAAVARGGAASGGGGAGGSHASSEGGARPATSASANLPEAPERGAVLAAIQSIEPSVRACAEADHGTATVRIVVAGSGRVTTATVSGQFSGTPVGSCVARAVRTGRFPQFSGERFEITYPFQL